MHTHYLAQGNHLVTQNDAHYNHTYSKINSEISSWRGDVFAHVQGKSTWCKIGTTTKQDPDPMENSVTRMSYQIDTLKLCLDIYLSLCGCFYQSGNQRKLFHGRCSLGNVIALKMKLISESFLSWNRWMGFKLPVFLQSRFQYIFCNLILFKWERNSL